MLGAYSVRATQEATGDTSLGCSCLLLFLLVDIETDFKINTKLRLEQNMLQLDLNNSLKKIILQFHANFRAVFLSWNTKSKELRTIVVFPIIITCSRGLFNEITDFLFSTLRGDVLYYCTCYYPSFRPLYLDILLNLQDGRGLI